MVLGRNLAVKLIVVAILASVNNGKTKYKMDPALNEFEILKPGKKIATSSPQSASSLLQVMQGFIKLKFKDEIARLYSFLPRAHRCSILHDLENATTCNGTFITNLLRKNKVIHNSTVTGCPNLPSRYTCKGNNITHKILGAFWDRIGDLFGELPVPFQCSIVNKIETSLSALKKRRHRRSSVLTEGKTLRIRLQMVERQLQKVFPTLNITQKCSKVWKPLKKKVPLQSLASLVNITIKLNEWTRRKAWIKRLKRKAFRIYNIYRRFYKQESKVSKKDVRLSVIRFAKKSRFVVNAVFSLEVKKSDFYQKISPAKNIIKAINSAGAVTRQRLFDGTVQALTGAKKDRAESVSIWTSKDIAEARTQFPSYLRSYFRYGIERLGRCLVMIYISTNLQRDLGTVENFYNSMNYLPEKYFCSSKVRKTDANITVVMLHRVNGTLRTKSRGNNVGRGENKIGEEENVLLEKINERENVTIISLYNDVPDHTEKNRKELDVSSSGKKMTPLEIGLLGLLALICVAIVAFTIYCITFIFKKRSAQSEDKEPPKSAFGLFNSMDVTRTKGSRKAKCENIASSQVENYKIDGILTNGYPGVDKSSNALQETQETNPEAFKLQQNIYSKDPLGSIPSRSAVPLNILGSKSLQTAHESNCESDDEVFSEHISPGVSNSDEYVTANYDSSTGGSTKHERQRTLKESCGEMKLLCEGPLKSSSSRDFDPYIRNNTMQVVVMIDDSQIST